MQGDYTGDLGVEKSYETYLRGEKGQEVFLRNAYGRIKGRYENGAFDREAVPGKILRWRSIWSCNSMANN